MSNDLKLKGINEIRGIAAILVLFFHLNESLNNPFWFMDRWNIGVTFFLCLSSFLITYILINEKNMFGQVNVINFYKRRILRIWPLYFLYLIVIILFFLVFFIPFEKNMIYFYVLFGANMPFLLGSSILLLGHYWTIATEEQFYFLYTFIINKVSNLSIFILKVLTVFLLIKLIARVIDVFFVVPMLTNIFQVFSFDTMLIGSFGALLYINNKNFIQNFLFFKWLQYLTLLVMILILFSKFHLLSIFDNQIVAFFELVLIYNVLLNKYTIFKIENKYLDYIGKISYGIYVYHLLVIFILKKIFIDFINMDYYWLLIFICTVLITFIISSLSYEYFEKYFLKLKQRYR